jgi:hypothetical protein
MIAHLLSDIAVLGPNASSLVGVAVGAGLFCLGRLVKRRRGGSVPSKKEELASAPPVTTRSSRFLRALRRPPVAVLVTDAEREVEPVAGWVIDRSTTGLRLELAEEGQIDPGTVLCVRPRTACEAVPWVNVEVTHRQAIKGGWQLACEFARVPPYSIRVLFG